MQKGGIIVEKRFGDLLQELRKEKGWTQQQLADLLNVTNKSVSKWERNEGYPETGTLLEISKLFGITVDDLLNGRNETINQASAHTVAETVLQQWQIVQARLISKCLLAVGMMLFYGLYFLTHHFALSFFVLISISLLSLLIIVIKNKKLEVFTGANQMKQELMEWSALAIACFILVIPCYNWKVKITPEDMFWTGMSSIQPDYMVNEAGELFISAYMTLENYLAVLPFLAFLSIFVFSVMKSILNKKCSAGLKIGLVSIVLVLLIGFGSNIVQKNMKTAKTFDASVYEKYKETYLNITERSVGIPEDLTNIDADVFDDAMTGMYERYKDIVGFDDETYTVYYEQSDINKKAWSSVLKVVYTVFAGVSALGMLIIKEKKK